MTTIERPIYFFRVDAGFTNGKPKPFDPIPTLTHIDSLPFSTGENSRYSNEGDKVLCCWVDSKVMPCKIRFGTIRRHDLPQIETQGEIIPLEIPEIAGLVETTHIVFIEKDIVGADFNFYGPRVSRLPFYFSDRAFRIAPPEINFSPIIRIDIIKQLRKIKYLILFQLRIRAPFVENIKDVDDSLSASFAQAIQTGQADDIEIILRTTRRSGTWLNPTLLVTAQRLLGLPDIFFEGEKFVVKGYNRQKEKIVDLDLLSDKLFVKKPIARAGARSKALNPIAAYDAISSAYEELKDEIKSSASVGN